MHVAVAGAAIATVHTVDAGMAETVIGRALLRIGQHRIGLVDFLEPTFGFFAAVVAVGMVLHGELAEGGLELPALARPAYAEHLVIITLHLSVGP